jgi:hypothetical protein
MSSRRPTIRWNPRALRPRELALLLGLLGVVVIYGTATLVESLYLAPSRELKQAVAAAEEQLEHQRRLLSRSEQIHAAYRRLESPVVAAADSARTENEILRELSVMAGEGVHVKSVVPRLGHHEGAPVMFVALDCEGPFVAVYGYLERILLEMPSEISNLSIAPQPNGEGTVICRVSIRVGGLGTSTGT